MEKKKTKNTVSLNEGYRFEIKELIFVCYCVCSLNFFSFCLTPALFICKDVGLGKAPGEILFSSLLNYRTLRFKSTVSVVQKITFN